MTDGTVRWRKPDPPPAPGDDVVAVPPPVTEEPPHDRFCDLVLTGGVASGVVYPWAIVELARAYRFRNIGGSSVGAMAAALAAAAEYGRRTGYEAPFEALRRSPASLAENCEGRTRMLALFQTNPYGKRLIHLWGTIFCGSRPAAARDGGAGGAPTAMRVLVLIARLYRLPIGIGVVAGACLGLLTALLGAVLGLAFGVARDIHLGLIRNEYGLCKGGTLGPPGGPPGISQWLHDGIQASAGLRYDDRPLTFRDLWTAPAYPGAQRQPCGRDDPPHRRAINLEMLTTNATHGRPYRLPMLDRTSRLFYRPEELRDYFPCGVLDAMVRASRPYEPDPRWPGRDPDARDPGAQGLLELPAEDLPVVVAARLSLSFPLLFSAVPLYAVDYEADFPQRTLRRCIFTDGGASSNFPIHLFDAAVPRWPTFGLWLGQRTPYPGARTNQPVWLPEYSGEGERDSWNRFDPGSGVSGPGQPGSAGAQPGWGTLAKFLHAIVDGAKDWHDWTSLRMPHVRNRVARLLLEPGETGMHIGMPREQILRMADQYGTAAGKLFVSRFAGQDGHTGAAWNEQRWVRFQVLVNALRQAFDGLGASAAWATQAVPLAQAIEAATRAGPVRDHGNSHQINASQAAALTALLRELENLERTLAATPVVFDPVPAPELRVSPPL